MLCSSFYCFFFFFNDTATTEIYTLSLHDALPIRRRPSASRPTPGAARRRTPEPPPDRKSTRLNSSHVASSYAVFCLKKKKPANFAILASKHGGLLLYDIFIYSEDILFFFFNYTATTEIYTLSLHDALPISRRPGPARAACPRPGGRCGRARTSRDRKSTRLNSSHVAISYAVFCLKKKQTKDEEGKAIKKNRTPTHKH